MLRVSTHIKSEAPPTHVNQIQTCPTLPMLMSHAPPKRLSLSRAIATTAEPPCSMFSLPSSPSPLSPLLL